MKNTPYLALCIIWMIPTAFAFDCPAWNQAEKNLKLHNYRINKLSPIGIKRSVLYLENENRKSFNMTGLIGYRASTTFYQFVEDGHAVGGTPANKSMIILYSAKGKCLAQIGGSIEEITSILDGTAERLSESIAH